jgi:DNA mismatch repair ATPase MutS
MKKIHVYLNKFKQYLGYTIDTMTYYSDKANKLTKYSNFLIDLEQNKQMLSNLHNELCKITPFAFSFAKMNEIGHIMYNFYQIYNNTEYNNAMLYSFGFNGYFTMLCTIGTNIADNKLVKTTFSKRKLVFKQMYYPKFINNETSTIVKNDCKLYKNMIITGPNASGKTTTLKTALLNILLSQQIGFGCFDSLKLTPFDKFHCYLNIPDTSGRDSLFQAEARRCKEILDSISVNKQDTHFCAFDELYSGTNPEEAEQSATAFMKYITKYNQVSCLLTTHFIRICKKLGKSKTIINNRMLTEKIEDNLIYKYVLEKGISDVKGGIIVLKQMDYPKEIIDNTMPN